MTRWWLVLAVALGGCGTYFGDGSNDPTPDAGSAPGDHDAGSAGSGSGSGYAPRCPDEPDPVDAKPPGACTQSLTLSLADNPMEQLAAVPLGTSPSTFCLTLDTTVRTHPTYFEAQTPLEPGTRSKFAMAFYSSADELLCMGYDVPLTSTTQTYATVSVEIDEATVFDLKLVAWARQSPATTPLSLSVYQILD